MDLYSRIVLAAFTDQVVPREVLGVLNPSERYCQEQIKKALDAGHIRENVRRGVRGKSLTTRYISATPSGIRYLIGSAREGSWLGNIPRESTLGCAAIGRNVSSVKQIRRIAQISAACVMCTEAGAVSPLLPHYSLLGKSERQGQKVNGTGMILDEPEDEETDGNCGAGHTYCSLITDAVRRDRPEIKDGSEIYTSDRETAPARFHPAREVKRRVYGSTHDADRSRTVGIAESSCRSLLLFATDEPCCRWTETGARTERSVAAGWNRFHAERYRPPDGRRETCGALFVRNARHFGSIYGSGAGERGVAPGEGFDSFHIIPLSYEGVRFLGLLLEKDDAEIEREVTGRMETAGLLSAAPGSPGDLRYLYGTLPCAFGCLMDMRQLRRLERYAASGRPQEFGIICFAWQMDYLRRLFPEAELIEAGEPECRGSARNRNADMINMENNTGEGTK